MSFNIENKSGILLTDTDCCYLDAGIEFTDLYEALKSMKPDRTPGLDGLSREFYLCFFELLKRLLLKMYHWAFKTGHLAETTRQGVIQLIPKKSRDILELRNWRPLTLLNYDYKILAHIFEIRLEKINNTLIAQDQNGFLLYL